MSLDVGLPAAFAVACVHSFFLLAPGFPPPTSVYGRGLFVGTFTTETTEPHSAVGCSSLILRVGLPIFWPDVRDSLTARRNPRGGGLTPASVSVRIALVAVVKLNRTPQGPPGSRPRGPFFVSSGIKPVKRHLSVAAP